MAKCRICGSEEGTAGCPWEHQTAPFCYVHQHYKWCEHNGGMLGPTGHEAPRALTLGWNEGAEAAALHVPLVYDGDVRGYSNMRKVQAGIRSLLIPTAPGKGRKL